MRCSSCSAALDEYVEGTLSAARRALVETHVAGCTHCAALLDELRVVDALLLTAQTPVEPPLNFTFKVMAEVRAMPPPQVRRTPVLRVLATYLAFAWVAIAGWFALSPASAGAAFATLREALAGDVAALAATGTAVSSVFGYGVYGVAASVWAILALDFIAAFTALAVYFFIRPRLLARLAALQEVN